MKRTKFTMPPMSQVDFSLSYVDLPPSVALNHDTTHIHRECEIYLNLSGEVSFEVENRIYPVSPGTVILTRPYEYHHCICHSDVPHRHYWITFSAQETEDYLSLFFRREKFAGIVAADRALPRPLEVLCMLRTFAVFLVGLLVFRAQSVRESIRWFSDVLSPSAYGLLGELPHEARVAGPMVALLIACEWLNRREPFGFARYPRNLVLRWAIYFFIALLVLLYSPGSQTFVYFQF